MILNSTTKKIQLILSGLVGDAVATNQLSVVASWVDFTATTTTPGTTLSTSNNETAVDIVAAPGANTQRKVNWISVCNRDTDFVYATVRLNDNGTLYNYVSGLLLAPDSTLQFTDTRGWIVIDCDGNEQVASGAITDIQTFTSNGIWLRPSGITYAHVDVCGGGGSGGGGSSAASGIRAGGGGGGGARRVKRIFLAADLSPAINVTIGSGATSTAAETDGTAGGSSSFGVFLTGYGGGGGSWNTDTVAGAGGGGGGGTTIGVTVTAGTGGQGGSAFGAGPASGNSSATDQGAGGGSGGTAGAAGGSGMYGGGGGGGGSQSAAAAAGGSSHQSAAGGGGGGGTDGDRKSVV